MINFKRAEIVKAQAVRQALAPISPNRKRKRAVGAKEVRGDNGMLESIKEDPRIQNQVDLEVSRIQGRGEEALYTLQGAAGLII